MKSIKLADKIGEGNFRECFAVAGEPGLCVKRLKPGLGLLQRLHLRLLRPRMNQEELDTYNRLPELLKPYFNPVIDARREYLVTARPLDYDGSHSKPVCDYGRVSNEYFWEEIEKIVELFEQHNIWFFDAFQIGTNVFVQRLSEEKWKPIIVDYKRLGWKSYPVQLNLLFDTEKRRKFYRKYRRFVQNFRADDKRNTTGNL